MIILKNAYVFTFNKNNDFGRYSLLINDNRITDIADSGPNGAGKVEKWIEQYSTVADIVDCSQKIIMPPIVNSCLKSEGSLIHYLLMHRHYESTEGDLCTDLIFNYLYQDLPGDEVLNDLENIYNYSFNRELKSGISFLNEFSLRKDITHLPYITDAAKSSGQRISACYPIKQDVNTIRDYKYLNPSYYLTQENLLTIYDISSITELRSHNVRKLFLEVATNKEVTDKFKLTFHKSIIALLDEYGLIDENASLINPLYLGYDDLKIITDKGANIIICPRDLSYFTNKYFPIDDYIGHGIKFSIGTGWLGEDLLKDVRLFRNKYKELNLSSAELLHSITKVPYHLYFNGDTGDSSYSIDINKSADMIFIDLSDARFQFFPEDSDFESIADFIIDNLTSYNISDVLVSGTFKVRDNKLVDYDEDLLIENINKTRNNLYKAGKYEELKKRRQRKENIERLDLGGRTDDEVKLFSDTSEESPAETKEEFKVKVKMPVYKPKPAPGQRSLFEEIEQSHIVSSDDFQNTPELNLLITDAGASKPVEEDLVQVKVVDETIIKSLSAEKKIEKKPEGKSSPESKIELPKNVKLKFGE